LKSPQKIPLNWGSDQFNYLIWLQNAEKTGLIFSLERRFCHGNEPFKIFLADHSRTQTCDKRILSWKSFFLRFEIPLINSATYAPNGGVRNSLSIVFACSRSWNKIEDIRGILYPNVSFEKCEGPYD